MTKPILTSCLFTLLLALACQVGAQQAATSKSVSWVPVGGKDNEFVIHMPEGFVRHANEGIVLSWNGHQPRVNSMGAIARVINGSALLMTYYNGDAEGIQRMKVEMQSLVPVSAKEVGDFKMKEFRSTYGKTHRRVQHYLKGQRLYVLESFTSSVDDKISSGFFDSVRVIRNGKAIAPNVPAGATQTWLPNLSEPIQTILDSRVYEPSEIDRDIIVIYSPTAREDRHFIKGTIPQYSEVEIVYGASGKVERAIGLKGLLTHQDNSIEAIKNSIFIPAQKDGKPVSVRWVIRYRK